MALLAMLSIAIRIGDTIRQQLRELKQRLPNRHRRSRTRRSDSRQNIRRTTSMRPVLQLILVVPWLLLYPHQIPAIETEGFTRCGAFA